MNSNQTSMPGDALMIKLKNTCINDMEEKYIKFYMSFHKAFQGKKSNSLFHSSQSRLNRSTGGVFLIL